MSNLFNDSEAIVTQYIDELKIELGSEFSIEKVNLAEMQRVTGISRKKLRRLKENNFEFKPNGNTGKKAKNTVLTGYTGIIDNLMRSGVSNSAVIYSRLVENGYSGKLTQVKMYIKDHKNLLPPKRHAVSPQGNRGRRYTTGPGESYQMDWGFVNVTSPDESTFQVACFAMICHHCGKRFTEFFPNAMQENLFIGMIHAFQYMGVPKYILTDNMKSVVIRRDSDGKPIWNNEYAVFMNSIGFETKLCKPRHPFTKGAVERLVRFIKENFLPARVFYNITDLNEAAVEWCDTQNGSYHRAVDCTPSDKHADCCMGVASVLNMTPEIRNYLYPIRKISFDGFISYEGRRFGVPYWYTESSCRVCRSKDTLYIASMDLKKLLVTHTVTWSRRDSFCENQYADIQPEEMPTMPVKVNIHQIEEPKKDTGFAKFNFDSWEDVING